MLSAMKDSNAVALGKKGGDARAKKLSRRRRKLIATNAANARWSKGDINGKRNMVKGGLERPRHENGE